MKGARREPKGRIVNKLNNYWLGRERSGRRPRSNW